MVNRPQIRRAPHLFALGDETVLAVHPTGPAQLGHPPPRCAMPTGRVVAVAVFAQDQRPSSPLRIPERPPDGGGKGGLSGERGGGDGEAVRVDQCRPGDVFRGGGEGGTPLAVAVLELERPEPNDPAVALA